MFMIMQRFLCAIFLVVVVSSKNIKRSGDDLFELSVVHINDFHARFEETNTVAGTCKEEGCIGGFSRTYSQIEKLLKDAPDSILLNGGDNFQGTIWYTFFKWNVTQYFLNKLPFDAIVLGNHEFDDNIQGVVPFIKALKAPVVVSNIDDSEEPDIQGLYTKSVVIERNGKKIGIIGVIVSTCDEISNTGKLKFHPESASVNAEAERLVREEGVFTNIVLSHSGYDVEQGIAKNSTGKIGLVVGGHSHSFLYTGEPVPGPDHVEGPYPTIVENGEGKKVLVTQASAYSKYVGNISVVYDGNGDVVEWSGAPIFLDTDKPQDDGMNAELKPWKDEVDVIGNKVLGSTLVKLDSDTCSYSECLLGDYVTDAMVYSYFDKAEPGSWTYASIAITNAGGLRTDIQIGNITYNDMVTAQPFANTFDVSDIEGKYLKEMLEFCTTPYNYGRNSFSINLLQFSGIHVFFNLSQPEGSRAQSVKIRCRECDVPIYEDLDVTKTYRIITPSFLSSGGDGFTVISDNIKNKEVGEVDIEVYQRYLKEKSPIFQEVEGRIEIVSKEKITMTLRK